MFRENNIDFERVNYFVDPLTEDQLRSLLKKAGLAPFAALRKGEAAFKDLGLTKETPEAEIIAAMVKFPGLLQRPIVEVGDKAVMARPIEKALQLISEL
ncbi:MAG: arsenate reductase [Acidobacteria bacterium]|nr:arsenate reductase [Acidobacteriota bacterium]MBK8813234.1 arsenate reductase [Acidobacteriota bacterium]